jgi:ATP-dependent protease ClpP protease subunit
MYHGVSLDPGYNFIVQHRQDHKEDERLQNLYDNILIGCSKLTLKILDPIKERKNNWYFEPEEAIKYGVIDEII